MQSDMRLAATFAVVTGLVFLSWSALADNGNTDEGEVFSKTYPPHAYLADLDELAETLTETHPQPYAFTSKESFWEAVAEAKRAIDENTTFSEFLWHCSSIVARLGCGHTSLGYFNQEDQILPVRLRFPVEARLIGSQVLVLDPLVNAEVLAAGDVIESINGRDVLSIRSEVFGHVSSDGHSDGFPTQVMNAYFTSYVAYAMGFPTSYQVAIAGRSQPVQLQQLEWHSHRKRVGPQAACRENLCLDIAAEEDRATLTVRTFDYYGDRGEIFKAFVDDSFQRLRADDIGHLIVDLRLNGGGSGHASRYLLQHIATRPFAYFSQDSAGSEMAKQESPPSDLAFRGKTYLLMDGNGTSSTGHFLSLAKFHGFATLIGEESGATYTCNDNSQRFTLTNTGVSYKVARTTFSTAVSGFSKGRGIIPDHPVQRSLSDAQGLTDTVLEFAVSLIRDSAETP